MGAYEMATLALTLADAQQAVTLAGAQQAATLADAQQAGAQSTHWANHANPVTPTFLALLNYWQHQGHDHADTWSESSQMLGGNGQEAPNISESIDSESDLSRLRARPGDSSGAPSEIPSLEGAVSDRLHDATVDTREDTWHSELIIQTDHSVPFIIQTDHDVFYDAIGCYDCHYSE
jgi:hypothetical protein